MKIKYCCVYKKQNIMNNNTLIALKEKQYGWYIITNS